MKYVINLCGDMNLAGILSTKFRVLLNISTYQDVEKIETIGMIIDHPIKKYRQGILCQNVYVCGVDGECDNSKYDIIFHMDESGENMAEAIRLWDLLIREYWGDENDKAE